MFYEIHHIDETTTYEVESRERNLVGTLESNDNWRIYDDVKNSWQWMHVPSMISQSGSSKNDLNHSPREDIIGKLHPVSNVYFVITLLLTMKIPSEQH